MPKNAGGDGEAPELFLRVRPVFNDDLWRDADEFRSRAGVEPLLHGDTAGARHGYLI